MKSNIDFILNSIPLHILRNKSKGWKENTNITFRTLLRFMKANNLLSNFEFFDGMGNLIIDTVIKKSSITDKDIYFMK